MVGFGQNLSYSSRDKWRALLATARKDGSSVKYGEFDQYGS